MPIYEYFCNACDKKFEMLVMGKETPECPTCGAQDINRLMSACGFISKGGSGETVSMSAGDSGCGPCSASSCSGCGV